MNDYCENRARGSRNYNTLLLLLLLLLPSGCIREDLSDCPPVTRLVYRYDREGESGGRNVLPVFVSGIIQYIFDENERLVAVDTVRPDDNGKFVSRQQLAPGRYTVSGWGNVRGASRVKEAAAGQEMELYLDNETSDGTQGASERLFYGHREFTVAGQGESKVYVDMTHAHCVLTFTVWWKNEAVTPAATGDFNLVLRDVPSRYGFFPGFRAENSTVINYIPVVHDRERLVTRREVAGMKSKRLRGEIITYRLSSDCHPVLTIHDGESLLEREIDLHRFFSELGIRLDEVLRQEYRIGIEIWSDRVVASLITASVIEWKDGKL